MNVSIIFIFFITSIIIQRITSSEMCSLHLTHPSAHTLGAVGSRGADEGSVPCSRVSPQFWTIPAGAEKPQMIYVNPVLKCYNKQQQIKLR